MKSYTVNPTKRQKRNEQINYSRIISAIEALVDEKRTTLDTVPIFSDTAQVLFQDIQFWRGRVASLREKQLSE